MLAGLKHLFSNLRNSASSTGQDVSSQSAKVSIANSELPLQTKKTIKQAPLNLKVIGDTYYRQLVGVTSLHHSPLNAHEREVLKQIDELIQAQHKSATLIPRLPGVIPKLMTYLRVDDYNNKDIARLISSDPVLVAEVLRLANSPYLRTSTYSNDLDQAIFQLGHAGLREIIMSVALTPIMQFDKNFFHQEAASNISELSQKAAAACRCLAAATNVDPFDAYVAGLMHNTGSIVVLRQLNQVPKTLEMTRSKYFQHGVIKFATQLSLLIAQQWDLSDSVVTSLKEQIGSHRIRPGSSIGQVLELGIRIAQLHTLVSSGHYDDPSYLLAIIAKQPFGKNSVRAYNELDNSDSLQP